MATQPSILARKIPWTVCSPSDFSVHGISRKEYWRGLPFPPPGYLPDPRIQLTSLASPALAGGFFTTASPGKPSDVIYNMINIINTAEY